LASGYTVTIHNQAGATIRGGGSLAAAILTGNDKAIIHNAGLIDGSSSGKAIEMGGSLSNSLTITGGSASILGSINGGAGGTNTMAINPGAGNSFSYAGAISNFTSVEVQSGNVTFSGISSYTGNTRLSGGTLTLDGVNRLDAASALDLNGGTLQIANAAGLNGQTFASLALSDNSTLDLGSASITFSSLGTIGSGKTLTVLSAASGTYAFKLSGNYSGDAAFARLMSGTTINGVAASYHFDGSYTDVAAATVAAVPEPESYAMLLAGLGLVGVMVRRRRHGAA
jgi:autotransporter-associated beta strand protein